MISAADDAALVNRIANHPAVRPYIALHGGALDFSLCIGSPDHRILTNGTDAAALFEWSAPGVWEGHTMFLPTCRGRRAVETGKAFCAWMFADGADLLWGNTPIELRHVLWFNRRLGFKAAGLGLHHTLGEVARFRMMPGDIVDKGPKAG